MPSPRFGSGDRLLGCAEALFSSKTRVDVCMCVLGFQNAFMSNMDGTLTAEHKHIYSQESEINPRRGQVDACRTEMLSS